jgi:hypothetical protein
VLDIGRHHFYFHLTGRQLALGLDVGALDFEQVIFVRRYAIFCIQGKPPEKPPRA